MSGSKPLVQRSPRDVTARVGNEVYDFARGGRFPLSAFRSLVEVDRLRLEKELPPIARAKLELLVTDAQAQAVAWLAKLAAPDIEPFSNEISEALDSLKTTIGMLLALNRDRWPKGQGKGEQVSVDAKGLVAIDSVLKAMDSAWSLPRAADLSRALEQVEYLQPSPKSGVVAGGGAYISPAVDSLLKSWCTHTGGSPGDKAARAHRFYQVLFEVMQVEDANGLFREASMVRPESIKWFFDACLADLASGAERLKRGQSRRAKCLKAD